MTSGDADLRRRRLRAAAFIVIVAAGGGWLALSRRGAASAETVTIHREDLPITVTAEGELDAVRSSLIGPPVVPSVWDFKIASMALESTQVRRGDPLLSLDTTRLRDELQRRQVEYDEAVKSLEKRDVDLAIQIRDLELQLAEAESRLRKQALKAESPEDLSGAVDVRIARLDRDLAAKEVESLRVKVEGFRRAGEADKEAYAGKRDRAAARIRELNDSIAKMSIAAPQDGVVIYQVNWQGEKKKVGDSTWRAEKILKIPDLSEMIGKAQVDEVDASRLVPGQRAVIRLDALPDAEFAGSVKAIGRIVQRKSRDNPLKVYTVDLALDRTDPARMRPGMRLRAEIEVDRVPGALVAPREAVFLRASGPVVFRRSGLGFAETPVKIGRRNANLVEILEGAAEGDLLARRDLARSREGEAGSARGGPRT